MAGIERLQQLIEPGAQAIGVDLWGVEHHVKGRNVLLRVFIDKADGVSVEDCARVSRQISSVLEVEDPIAGEYTLEVSSPGTDRPLFTLSQYGQLAGLTVRLRLRTPFEGRKVFTGLLNGIDGDSVLLVANDEEYLFPFETIERGNVVSPPGSTESGGAHSE